jgi:AcrR family transcriptional regulator
MNKSRSRKSDPAVIERQRQALTYRKAGASLRVIASKLGVSVGTVHKDLERSLKAVIAADLRDLAKARFLELERLDDLWRAVWERALKGDLFAVDTCLKISERRCKLLGLEAAQKVELLLSKEIDAVLQRLQGVLQPDDFSRVMNIIINLERDAKLN